jgi:hypothetical protein
MNSIPDTPRADQYTDTVYAHDGRYDVTPQRHDWDFCMILFKSQ